MLINTLFFFFFITQFILILSFDLILIEIQECDASYLGEYAKPSSKDLFN